MLLSDIRSGQTAEEWEAGRENREKRRVAEDRNRKDRDRKRAIEDANRRKNQEIRRYDHVFVDYHKYLKSKEWQNKRKQVMDRCGGICEACKANPATQIHHITYQNLGNENLWELLGTCEKCYETIHGIRGESK